MYEKEIIKKWIKEAFDKNDRNRMNHFMPIEDKLLGLHPANFKLENAYRFIEKNIDESKQKHIILNYLIGVIHAKKTDR
jgi:hypothetical protein